MYKLIHCSFVFNSKRWELLCRYHLSVEEWLNKLGISIMEYYAGVQKMRNLMTIERFPKCIAKI